MTLPTPEEVRQDISIIDQALLASDAPFDVWVEPMARLRALAAAYARSVELLATVGHDGRWRAYPAVVEELEIDGHVRARLLLPDETP